MQWARKKIGGTQGFMQGTQRTQEVANNMAGICHVIMACAKLECSISPARRVLDMALFALFAFLAMRRVRKTGNRA